MPPQDALKSVMASIEARLNKAEVKPSLALDGFSSRLVSGDPVFTHRLRKNENSQIRVPAARFSWQKCPENVCIFTNFDDPVDTVYVMPFSNPELKLETDVAEAMIHLLFAAEGKPEEVPCCEPKSFFLLQFLCVCYEVEI